MVECTTRIKWRTYIRIHTQIDAAAHLHVYIQMELKLSEQKVNRRTYIDGNVYIAIVASILENQRLNIRT